MQDNDDFIPFFDLSRQGAEHISEWMNEIERIVRSGKFQSGPEVPGFEKAFAEWLGAADVVGCASGTDALEVALRAWQIGPGDEVIVPANTWVSDAEAVLFTGATPVFADVLDETGQLDPAGLEPLITEKTRVIIAVHMYGSVCDLGSIMQIARRHNILVLEDCAHAIGLKTQWGMAGTLADAAVFSFYPTKNLGAFGDAGCIASADSRFIDRVRLIRDHGQPVKDTHLIVGKTSRMDEIQAAILFKKLLYVDQWNARRRDIAMSYATTIESIQGIQMGFDLNQNAVVHLFILRTSERDEFIQFMKKRGIGTAVHYPLPIPITPAFQSGNYRGVWSVAERRAKTIVSLPVFPELTDGEIGRINDALVAFGQK
ncbi:DegT/DnrJ/EryC1/StrS family aminotransferase [Fulvivirga sedimenti]|uniref:DegT/DnrJ/EryC1/StrS family aminotransferase n=1 Tax=Fulvivirga sedimenti TaxID=2879465 RepID=A0A9X1HVG4_9BACT|nr:DegT/DnrJ/EryC1/StrS family aminotransferase [Fulvivirga sedimenti]MCA6075227.1 DegT/DnrJ/EryC1/StrS family aminotransferase [Fulvivirga sedimenti]MCA6076404.1 DegT/DnrJ/EryC1/StrS family aminotransferase [Fulvivirga sedimenti]MCA6077532.1 DegT/DnrJ/EryC1/StrS family aminotransferase [Fulvivirga sedimenti]